MGKYTKKTRPYNEETIKIAISRENIVTPQSDVLKSFSLKQLLSEVKKRAPPGFKYTMSLVED